MNSNINSPAMTSNSSAIKIIWKELKNRLGLIIAAIGFLLYAQSISYNYNLDDSVVIQANNTIKQGIAGIPTIITKDRLYGVEEQSLRTPEYRPASFVMFALEWQFFPNNPHVSHFINVLLYALTCWLIFNLSCTLFEDLNMVIPFVASMLFMLHPIHTEVVDNIKSRDEILCFLFGIASIYLSIRAVKTKSISIAIAAGIGYFISLLSKETGIAFLIIVPVSLFYFSRSNTIFIGKIILVLLSTTALFFFIRAMALASMPHTNFNLNNNSISLATDFISREATAFYVLLRYIFLLIFPHPLSYDYSFDQIPIQSIRNPLVLISLFVYAGMAIYAVMMIRKKNIAAFAILFFLFSLAPVSNVFLLIGSNMSERFLYAPSLGFCIFLSFLLMKVSKSNIKSIEYKSVNEFFVSNSLLFGIFFLVGSLYSFKTISRNPDWRDGISLHSQDVQVSTNSARTHFNWGVSLLTELYPKEQNSGKRDEYLRMSINELKRTVEIFPNNSEAHFNLGDAYKLQKDYPNAIRHYGVTNRLFSKPSPIIYNNLGYIYGETGEYEKALGLVDSAIKAKPDYLDAYGNKGTILYKMGDFLGAISCFQKVIDMNPRKTLAYKMIGNCYLNLKDTVKAKGFYEKANSLNEGNHKI